MMWSRGKRKKKHNHPFCSDIWFCLNAPNRNHILIILICFVFEVAGGKQNPTAGGISSV